MRLLTRDTIERQTAAAALDVAAQRTRAPIAQRRPVAAEARRELPSAQRLSATAQHDLSGWLAELQLDPHEVHPARAIARGELTRGQAVDPRITAADMQRAVRLSVAAAQLTPADQRVLYGFTRLIDAKFTLTSAPGHACPIDVLAAAALPDPSDASALFELIDAAPAHANKPRTKVELVAALVRFALLGSATSLQVSIGKGLGDWLREVLATAQVPVRHAMGGAGGFSANMASVLPGVQARFYSADPIPGQIAERFSPSVRVIDATGAPATSAALATNQDNARVNWAVDWNAGESFTLLGRTELLVDGKPRALTSKRSARVIMSTPAEERPGFALDDSALRRLATQTDKFFGVGPHYLTKGTPERCRADAAELARQYRAMRDSNAKLLVHHQYVVPKVEANEAILMEQLCGAISSTALNASELPGLVQRLAAAGLVRWSGEVDTVKADEPSVQLAAVLALKSGLGLRRVHIHGLFGDLVVRDGHPDPERIKLASLRARQLASMKAASDSGELKLRSDVVELVPGVEGVGLAAVQRFADAAQQCFGLSPLERDLVAQRWWHRDAQGTVYVFTPARGIHDLTGGKVSLGDCIDNAQMIYEDAPGKPSLPPHPRLAARRLSAVTSGHHSLQGSSPRR